MGEDDRSPEDGQDWLNRQLDEIYGTTNDEKALNEARDTRPGPEELADKNLKEERKLHELLTLWFNVDGVTSVRQQRQASFQLPLRVFLGMLRGDSPEKIAIDLGCALATAYRHRKSIRFVLGFFDVFIIELETKLTDQMTIDVFHKIRIGWDRKQIIRQLEENEVVIDRAYITLRRESAKIWKEFKDKAKHDPESLVRLIEAQRRIER